MLKLLIVDDETRTREGLASLIVQNNFPVKIVGSASNGIDGLEVAKSYIPDIIITDVRMPRMDGIKFATEVRNINPDIQIIFISGYSDKQYLKSAITLNAIGYVEKPIDDQELFKVLSSAISSAEKNIQRINILKQNESLYEQQHDSFLNEIASILANQNIDKVNLEKLHMFYPQYFDCSHYCTTICQLCNRELSENKVNTVYEKIKKVLENYFDCFLITHKNNFSFIIHVGYNYSSQYGLYRNTMNQIFTELKHELSDITKFFFAVGIPVTKPEKIYYSYSRAMICLEKLFFTGYNHICYYYDGDDNKTEFKIDKVIFHSFNTAIRNDNCTEAALIAANLLSKCKKNIYIHQVNGIKNAYYQLLVVLNTICSEREFYNVFSCDACYIWEYITQIDTLMELHEYLIEKLSLYSDELVRNGLMSKCTYRIQQYIELHYREQSLSINKMAKELGFTPAYLCQVFKREKGTTINVYINTFRINKAMELLKNIDVKLYEVTYLVGYSDSNYFSRQFKKHVGMTPSEFRRKNII